MTRPIEPMFSIQDFAQFLLPPRPVEPPAVGLAHAH